MSVAVMKNGNPEYAAHAGKMKWGTMEDKPFSNIDPSNFEVVDDNLKLLPAITDPINLVINSYGDVYNPNKPYVKDELCIDDNKLWKCLEDNTGQKPGESVRYWKETTLPEEFGALTGEISALNDNLVVKKGSNYFRIGSLVVCSFSAKPTLNNQYWSDYIEVLPYNVSVSMLGIAVTADANKTPVVIQSKLNTKQMRFEASVGKTGETDVRGQFIYLTDDI